MLLNITPAADKATTACFNFRFIDMLPYKNSFGGRIKLHSPEESDYTCEKVDKLHFY